MHKPRCVNSKGVSAFTNSVAGAPCAWFPSNYPTPFRAIGRRAKKVEVSLPKRARLQTVYQTSFPIDPSKNRCA
jgi:hypothetical protein